MRVLPVFLAMGLAVHPLAAMAEATDDAHGRDLYVAYCASCHGMEARGDGSMAAILTVLPTDLTRIAEMNGGTFPYEHVARQVDGRDPFLAHGGVMPLYGAFFDGDPPPPSAVIELADGRRMLTTQPMADLLGYLESIQE